MIQIKSAWSASSRLSISTCASKNTSIGLSASSIPTTSAARRDVTRRTVSVSRTQVIAPSRHWTTRIDSIRRPASCRATARPYA